MVQCCATPSLYLDGVGDANPPFPSILAGLRGLNASPRRNVHGSVDHN